MESRSPNTTRQGKHRREHIKHLIEQSQQADELQRNLTDLYHASAQFQLDQASEEGSWAGEYARVSNRRRELGQNKKSLEEQLRSIEEQIAEIPDTDIQGLLDTLQEYKHHRDRFRETKVRNETRLEILREEERVLTRQRDKLLREQEKLTRIRAELNVIQDIEGILRKSYDRITNEELVKGERSNEHFLLRDDRLRSRTGEHSKS